jgi:hypothetical protein
MSFDITFLDGHSHQLAMYAVDWDQRGRVEQVQVVDSVTGVVLAVQDLADFAGGVYLVWNISGHVRINVTETAGIQNAVAQASGTQTEGAQTAATQTAINKTSVAPTSGTQAAVGQELGPGVVLSGIFFDRASTIRATANFVRLDQDTGGNWRGTYGAEGRVIAGAQESLPAYASFAAPSNRVKTREADPSDVRALESEGSSGRAADAGAGTGKALEAGSGPGRIASAWYDDAELDLELTVSDETPRQVAVYAVDWDGRDRNADVQVLDAGTGALLDAQSLSGFDKGVYLVWNVTGQIRIKVTRTAGPNAVLSGVFFGGNGDAVSDAEFVRADRTTRGNWRGFYGADGYCLADNSRSIPAYASFTIQNQAGHTFAAGTDDPRALQNATGAGRLAAMWQSDNGSSLDVGVNLIDGKRHLLAVYMLDSDGTGVAEQVQVLDAATEAVLDTEYVANSEAGVYLVWSVTGKVKMRVTPLSAAIAFVSGVFFGGDGVMHSSVSFHRLDEGTRGDWQSAYGTDGYVTAGGARNLPGYARLVGLDQPGVTWKAAPSDQAALGAPGGQGRIGAAWCNNPSLSFDLNLTDNQPHQFALYGLDFDHQHRSQVVQILDADTGTVLDSRAMTAFTKGAYLVWVLSGHVKINVIATAGPGTVIGGVFLGASNSVNSTAAFVGSDSVTQGNWQGVYGSAGYVIPGVPEKLPADMSLAAHDQQKLSRRARPDDARALVGASGPGRIGSAWYNSPELELDVRIPRGASRQTALYAVDWDGLGREEVVQIRDAATAKVLDTRVLSRFTEGAYLVWKLSGHVRISITRTAGPNAVVSGLFFDDPDANRGKQTTTANPPSPLVKPVVRYPSHPAH